MLKNLIFPILLALAVLFQSCDGYKKTDSGLKYKILTDSTGKNAEVGEVVELNLSYANDMDSMNTFKTGRPIHVMVRPDFKKGSIEEGLTLLSKGDSAVFLVSNDSLYRRTPTDSLPKKIKAGTTTAFTVKILKIYSKEEVKKKEEEYKKQQDDEKKRFEEEQKKQIEQLGKDTVAIESFLKSKGIKAKRTINGVYYVYKKNGSGASIARGDSATVNYTGTLLNGKQFDSSVGRGPFTLRVGVGGVIPGWDELLLSLKEGDKVTAYIPSPMAYAQYGSPPNIGPNEILVFDIEVLKVSK